MQASPPSAPVAAAPSPGPAPAPSPAPAPASSPVPADARCRPAGKAGSAWAPGRRLALLLALAWLLVAAPAGLAREQPPATPAAGGGPAESRVSEQAGIGDEAGARDESGVAEAPLVREWAVLAGIFDVGTRGEVGEVGAEARLRKFGLPLGSLELPLEPAVGAMTTGDGAAYAHLSFRLTLKDLWATPWSDRWRVVPFLGVGVYEAGDGKDLGGPVEFRSGVEVSYRAGQRWWLGATLYHLSNAVIYDSNPGEESLVVTLSWR